MDLQDLARIVTEAAQAENIPVDVIGVTRGEGSVEYAEVILSLRDCSDEEPCSMSLGVRRSLSEPALRSEVAEKLQHRLNSHSPWRL
jgi:hypothetical protein